MDAQATSPLGAVPVRSPRCALLIERVATRIETQVEAVAGRMIDRVTVEMRLDAADEELREDLLAAARGSVALITVMARSWTDPHVVPPPRDALLWARSLVVRGFPIEALLRVYRIGQAGYHEIWHRELLAEDPPMELAVEAISAISAFTFTWVDTISGPLVEAYEDERDRRRRGADAMRSEAVALALSGKPFDEQAVGARLRYDLRRTHVALVAWVDAEAAEAVRDALEPAVVAAAEILGGGRAAPLLLRPAPRVVHAWVPRVELDDAVLARARAALRPTGVRVALGAAGAGAAGFRDSHDQALRARRVARLLRPAAVLTAYVEVAIADLLTQDLPAAVRLARATLGPLAGTDDRARRLLATLRAFFDEEQSYARTARHLGIHENTIADRVRRALELTGHERSDLRALRTAVDLAPLLNAPPASTSPAAP